LAVYKRQRKQKEKPRMENPETLAILGTPVTRQRITNTTQKTKKISNTDHKPE
jgi:hypothetical protein